MTARIEAGPWTAHGSHARGAAEALGGTPAGSTSKGARVVSISGRSGSGKSTVARLLAGQANCAIASMGDAFERLGPFCLAGGGAAKTGGHARESLVVDGLHSLTLGMLLEKRLGPSYRSIHVAAPRELRMLRVLGWSERDREFYQADERSGPAIDELGPRANYFVCNGGSEEELARQVRSIAADLCLS